MNTAIIVLNYNDYKTTENYIKTIKNYSSITKIIVVDNNSPDGDFEKLKLLSDYNIDVIKSDKNGGYSYGNNYGIKYAEKKYGLNFFDTYIISNPDVYVEDEVIEKCNFKLHSNSKIAVVSPRMKYEKGVARRSAWKRRTYAIDIACSTRLTEFLLYPLLKKGEYSKKQFENNSELRVECIAGAFFLVKAKVFIEINYFDEGTFLFFEEDILGSKLEKLEYKIISMNDMFFIHYDSRTIGKIMSAFKKQKILFESRKYYHKTYNNTSKIQNAIFDVLYFIRCFELVFETIIFKVVKKFNDKRTNK